MTENVKSIMTARMQRYASMGCDGVEPDNTDQVTDPAGYVQWLSSVGHSLGLSVGLKNNAELAGDPAIVSVIDFAIVEQCYEFSECDSYLPIIQAGKALFDFEYNQAFSCSDANAKNIDAYRMSEALDGSTRVPCRTSGTAVSAPVPSAGAAGGAVGVIGGTTGGTAMTPAGMPVPVANYPTNPKCSVLPQNICSMAADGSPNGGIFELLRWVLRIMTVIGIIAYGLMVIFIQWLVPGGVF